MNTATAGSVITIALTNNAERLLAVEPAVRQDEPDAVHQMRVAARRLRSLLRSYAPLLKHPQVDRLRADLQWLGLVLGEARDAEVRAERAHQALAALPAELVDAPVVDRLVGTARSAYTTAHVAALKALDGPKHAKLRDRLTRLTTDPPLRRRANKPAEQTLDRLLTKECRRLNKLIKRAARASSPDDRTTALHDVRKAAKRLRYAAEAAVPALGERGTAIAKAAKELQTMLGDHRDAVASAEAITTAAKAARKAGEAQSVYRTLVAAEYAAAAEAIDRYELAVRELLV